MRNVKKNKTKQKGKGKYILLSSQNRKRFRINQRKIIRCQQFFNFWQRKTTKKTAEREGRKTTTKRKSKWRGLIRRVSLFVVTPPKRGEAGGRVASAQRNPLIVCFVMFS